MTKHRISIEDVKCLQLILIQKEHIILEEDLWNRNSMMKDKTNFFEGRRLPMSTNSNTISRSRNFYNTNSTDFSQNLNGITQKENFSD